MRVRHSLLLHFHEVLEGAEGHKNEVELQLRIRRRVAAATGFASTGFTATRIAQVEPAHVARDDADPRPHLGGLLLQLAAQDAQHRRAEVERRHIVTGAHQRQRDPPRAAAEFEDPRAAAAAGLPRGPVEIERDIIRPVLRVDQVVVRGQRAIVAGLNGLSLLRHDAGMISIRF